MAPLFATALFAVRPPAPARVVLTARFAVPARLPTGRAVARVALLGVFFAAVRVATALFAGPFFAAVLFAAVRVATVLFAGPFFAAALFAVVFFGAAFFAAAFFAPVVRVVGEALVRRAVACFASNSSEVGYTPLARRGA